MNPFLLLIWQIWLCLPVDALSRKLGPPREYREAIDNGTFDYYPKRAYVTGGEVKSPDVNFLQWDSQCDDGLYTFLTPRGHSLPFRPGPTILDNRGEMIWGHHFENSFGGEGYNFLVQKYKGEDILTFWLGDDRVRGHGAGFYYFMNSTYDIFKKVNAVGSLDADLHEFIITDEDTALVSIYETVPGDVSMFRDFDPVNIPNDKEPNYIWDGVFQEIDIENDELIFQWRASEHVNITDTYRPIYTMGNLDDPFDWFHINSVQKDELGNYLISARYTHSIIYIDGKTGDPIWQLGGKSNDFMDLSEGYALNFAWQHDARFRPLDSFPSVYTPPPAREGYTTRLLSLFDNAAEDQHYVYGVEATRGLFLELTYPTPGTDKAAAGAVRDPDYEPAPVKGDFDKNHLKVLQINGTDVNYQVRVIKSYENPKGVRSSSQGNVQLIDQGPGKDKRVLIGYGLSAVWTEFDANGTVLCDVHYAAETSWETGHMQSYRVYKFDWTGTPKWSPQIETGDEDEVYVSWLGSTEVTDWAVQVSEYETQEDEHWTDVLHVPKLDFETLITIPAGQGDARFLRVVALDDHGDVLPYGASNIIARGGYHGGPIRTPRPPASTSFKTDLSKSGKMTWTPLKGFFILVCTASSLFIVYEGYRRWLSWKLGRPSAGAFRWRKGVAQKWLGDG